MVHKSETSIENASIYYNMILHSCCSNIRIIEILIGSHSQEMYGEIIYQVHKFTLIF